MKKLFMVVLSLLISIAFLSTGLAQAKAAPKKQSSRPAAEALGFVGKVAQFDKTMLAVKGSKATVTFDARNPQLKGYKTIRDVMVGDTVSAKYTDNGLMITKLRGTGKTKSVGEKKTEVKKASKKKVPVKEKKAEQEKKPVQKDAVSQLTCTGSAPCMASIDKSFEKTETQVIRQITCTGKNPCTIMVAKLTDMNDMRRITSAGMESRPYVSPYPKQPTTQVNLEAQLKKEETNNYWYNRYYCQDPEGYYPNVANCPGGWTEVNPGTPGQESVTK